MVFGFKKKTPKAGDNTPEKKSMWSNFTRGLKRTREQLGQGLRDVCLGKKQLDDETAEAIETQLLMADVGVSTTDELITALRQSVAQHPNEAIYTLLRTNMLALLTPCEVPLVIPEQTSPFVILMVGINGAGKTTTIGKLAHHFTAQKHKVLLGAGDTFRAAAVQQLQAWGKRCDIPVMAQDQGADSAALLFDAVQSARAKGCNIVLADTAGRLHTQGHLMKELQKIKKVIAKAQTSAPHEVLLVLDASIGQNALTQVAEFHQAIGVTGLVITKLDGTAKGGILWAIAKQFGLPIRYVGIGENIEDLLPFNAQHLVDALLEPIAHEANTP